MKDFDFDYTEKESSSAEDLLIELKDEYNIENPKKILSKYYDLYLKNKNELFSLDNNSFITKFEVMMNNFEQFMRIDFFDIVNKLFENKSFNLFDCLILLQKKGFLKNIENLNFINEFISLCENEEKIRKILSGGNIENRLKIKTGTANEWIDLESEKEFYVLNIECGTKVSSFKKHTSEQFDSFDILNQVIVTHGLSYKSHFDFDKIIYLEV